MNIIKSLKLSSTTLISDDLSIANTSRILQILGLYRNICAYNERFYITKTKVPIDDIYMGFGEALPNSVDPSLGRRLNTSQRKKRLDARSGIYVLIFIISLFIDNKELNDFIIEINKEFKKLDDKLNTVSIDYIKRFMGLNFDWINLIKQKRSNY